MNAADRATSLEVATKIAATVNLFKSLFPDVKADLKPWMSDPDTEEWIDPDSLDIGFHFPGRSRLLQSRSILIQIRLYQDPLENIYRAIGVETAGYDHQGQQWKLSTVDNWCFCGNTEPKPEAGEKLKLFCRNIFELFNGDSEKSSN